MAITEGEALRRHIDDLADEQVERLLDSLEDPVLRSLMPAEADDEPLAAKEAAAADEGLAAAARRDVISTEELRRQLGLSWQPWNVTWTRPARQDLGRLQPHVAARIVDAVRRPRAGRTGA